MKQQQPYEKRFYRTGNLYEAGLVHAHYHRVLPTGRHWNFALHFRTFPNFWLNLKTFVRVAVQRSRIPSNWGPHFGITCLVMQQRALSVFKKVAALRCWQFDCAGIVGSKLQLLQPSLYCIVYCKNRVRCNKKQTPFVNTWKYSQACSWETEKTLRLSSRYSQKLAR